MKKQKLLNFYEHQQRAHDEYITHLRECEHRGPDGYLNSHDVALEIEYLEENFQIKMLQLLQAMQLIFWIMHKSLALLRRL